MLVREPEQKNSNSGHCQLWLGLAWGGARWWVGGGLGGRGGRGQAGPSNMMSVDIYKYICHAVHAVQCMVVGCMRVNFKHMYMHVHVYAYSGGRLLLFMQEGVAFCWATLGAHVLL